MNSITRITPRMSRRMHNKIRWILLVLLAMLCLTVCVQRVAADSDDIVDEEPDVEDLEEPVWTPPVRSESASKSKLNKNRPLEIIDLNNLQITDFVLEICMLSGLIAYIGFHFYGRKLNQDVATQWMQSSMHIWEAQFAHVGDEKKYTLVRDGARDFIFYASGREFVDKVYGYIKLMSRWDLFTALAEYAIPNAQKTDIVEIEITLNSTIEGCVFAILNKNLAPNLIKARYDLQDFANARTHPRLPKNQYVMVTDAPEFAAVVMEDEDIVTALWASTGLSEKGEGEAFDVPLIESIILTDQVAELPNSIEEMRNFPKVLRATFLIPPKEPTHAAALVKLLMNIVDLAGYANFSAECKTKLRKIRVACEERILKKQEEARKEELAKLKLEAKKKEEEKVGKLSAAEQRKYEEKVKKQEMKKKMKKMTKSL
ncbi:Coiled-coil domain-containing protein 47 [Blyttiomyces sp. JEL0837]|nr:Coiled-coil domain-containing protein 47 [Blyttiomyces sp. JEL0837]